MVLRWEKDPKSTSVSGVFTQGHFRVEGWPGEAACPCLTAEGVELHAWPVFSGLCATTTPGPQPLSHSPSRSLASAESAFAVTAGSSTCLGSHNPPTPPGLTFFPPQPGPTVFLLHLWAMYLDRYPCPASEPARASPQPPLLPQLLPPHPCKTGKFLKVAS